MNLKQRFGFIDFIKVVAIFSIIIFHVLYRIYPVNPLRPLGFFGVSLFFIVSGFLLAKNYPNYQKFSIKWFGKKYLKIASIYYLSILLVIILFGVQAYEGSLWKNIILHLFFIDPLFPAFDYQFISPAWFLTPLIILYFLFPYLNRLIKKNWQYIIPLFVLMIIFRFFEGSQAYTSFNPVFFIGDFCLGIVLAYYKYNWKILAVSASVILINPWMFLPILFFVIFSQFNSNFFSSSLVNWISLNTLPLFLLHESFIKVIFGDWKIHSLNIYFSLIILTLSSVIIVILSKKINKWLVKKFNN